jgi:hypothetical protein
MVTSAPVRPSGRVWIAIAARYLDPGHDRGGKRRRSQFAKPTRPAGPDHAAIVYATIARAAARRTGVPLAVRPSAVSGEPGRTRAPEGHAVHPFRAAIEAGDLPGALALLADDVVFRSPVVFKPYHGRAAVAPILAAVAQVFEEFRYVREIGGPGARDHALLFEARVGDRHLEGCDFLHTADDGLIDQFAVMVRPLSATLALAEAMQARLAPAPGQPSGQPL